MPAEYREQFGAMRHRHASHPPREFIPRHPNQDFAIRPPQSPLRRRDGLRQKFIRPPQHVQRAQSIPGEPDPRADFPEFCRLLVYFDIHSDSP